MLQRLRDRKSAQPEVIEFKNPGKVLVHNRELGQKVAQGFSAELIRWSFARLKEEGSFDIPINSRGVMVAASGGEYAKKAWDRDHLRGLAGIIAGGRTEDAKRMLDAIISRMAVDTQRFRIIYSVKNPDVWRQEGHDILPQVVFNPDTLQDVSSWSIQKDAWGLFLHSVMDGFERGLISNLSNEQKISIVGMFSLMGRIGFWDLETADSWEEEAKVFTSGVSLVTGALERLVKVLKLSPEDQKKNPLAPLVEIINEAKSNSLGYGDLAPIIENTLNVKSLEHFVGKGYERIFKQLRDGVEAPNFHFIKNAPRKADTAMLWLFFYRLEQFQEADYQRVLELTDSLVRAGGMLRYETPDPDLYLNPAYFFEDDETVPEEIVRKRDHRVTGKGVRNAAHSRFAPYLNDLFGTEYSAQWSLGVITSVQAYAKMLKWFPGSDFKAKYQKKVEDYFLRMLGTVSPGQSRVLGKGTNQEQAVNLKGELVTSYRFPEAITPVRTFGSDLKVKEEFWAFSPYTQLNWAASEATAAYQLIWGIYFSDAFPGTAN